MDTTTCIVCGRPYNRSSHPFWVADERGVLLGTAHASHWSGYPPRPNATLRKVCAAEHGIAAARFVAWHDATYDVHDPAYDLLAATLVFGEPPQDAPSERQADYLAHWSSPGNSYGPRGAEAAWSRYRELVAEYRAWEHDTED
jgi:hypothetical protein